MDGIEKKKYSLNIDDHHRKHEIMFVTFHRNLIYMLTIATQLIHVIFNITLISALSTLSTQQERE